jgi:hypothetical protein
VVLDPEPARELFSGMDGFFTVTGYSFINGDGNKTDILPAGKKPAQHDEKCGAVLTPAQGNGNPVPGYDEVPVFYGIGHPLFHVSGKMRPAQVTAGMPLENNCRFPAQGTERHAGSCGLPGQGSASMGNTDNPDFILRPDNRILGYESPVPGHDHLKRINALFGENLFNGGRAVIKNPALSGRNNEFHASPCRLVSRFLKTSRLEEKRGG